MAPPIFEGCLTLSDPDHFRGFLWSEPTASFPLYEMLADMSALGWVPANRTRPHVLGPEGVTEKVLDVPRNLTALKGYYECLQRASALYEGGLTELHTRQVSAYYELVLRSKDKGDIKPGMTAREHLWFLADTPPPVRQEGSEDGEEAKEGVLVAEEEEEPIIEDGGGDVRARGLAVDALQAEAAGDQGRGIPRPKWRRGALTDSATAAVDGAPGPRAHELGGEVVLEDSDEGEGASSTVLDDDQEAPPKLELDFRDDHVARLAEPDYPPVLRGCVLRLETVRPSNSQRAPYQRLAVTCPQRSHHASGRHAPPPASWEGFAQPGMEPWRRLVS